MSLPVFSPTFSPLCTVDRPSLSILSSILPSLIAYAVGLWAGDSLPLRFFCASDAHSMFLPEGDNFVLSTLDWTHDEPSDDGFSLVCLSTHPERRPAIDSPQASAASLAEETGSAVASKAFHSVPEATAREYPKRIRWASSMAVPLAAFPLSSPPPPVTSTFNNPIHLLSQDWQRFLTRMFVCMRRAADSATSRMSSPPVDFGGLLLW